MCPIEAQCIEEKAQARTAFFIGQDFGVSDARAVVDRPMQILPAYPTAVALALALTGDAVAELLEPAELFDIDVADLAGMLAVAGATPTATAIWLPVSRCRRKASITAQVAGAVWLGNERGLEERSRKPSTPSARKRSTHLATVFAVVLNWRAAAALLSPASTHRTMASRPFGVREAFLWLLFWLFRAH